MKVDVVVPSYRRPALLERCLEALHAQTVEPESVLVVARRDDEETRSVASTGGASVVDVGHPGVVAALTAGVAVSRAEVVAFTDDDAAPRPDWLELLLAAFADPTVSAAGGRDVIPGETAPRRADVGRLTRSGRLVGNHHLGTGNARDVDVLKGVNMAVRADALALPARGVLRGGGAEVHWEPLVCAAAARRGRVVYDPRIEVDHARAERSGVGRPGRAASGDVRDAAHNFLVATSALGSPARQALYCFALGSRATPGVGRALAGLARGELEVVGRLVPSLAGFALALRAGRAATVDAASLRAGARREVAA